MADKKEQMQIIILGVLMGLGAIFALVFFLLMPINDATRQAKEEAVTIEASLEDIRKVVKDRASVDESMFKAIDSLKEVESRIPLPVMGNFMIEMEEKIRACLAGTGVNAEAITSAGSPSPLKGGSGAFQVFQTRVIGKAGYHNLAKAFHIIQNRYPYVSISGMTISPEDNTPEEHTVNFVISWLIWTDPENRPSLREQE
jgi:hypothetical protein